MDGNLIKIRRAKVDGEISLLKERIAKLTSELAELDIAERVINRLSGMSADPDGQASGREPAKAYEAKASGSMTVRQMVTAALMDARQKGEPGLTPSQVREFIRTTYAAEIGQQINTNLHRMYNDLKEIAKDEATGLYSLPSKENPADDVTVESPSAGLFDTQAQGREAGPGGGA